MGRSCLIALALGLLAAVSWATPVTAPHVRVELLTETTSLRPGHDLPVGVRFTLDEGWHVYWRNPGDSGEAPSVAWTLPPGFVAGEIEWPQPERIMVGPLVNFGYDGSVLLPATILVPRELRAETPVELRALVKWLVCDAEECIPGSATLGVTLPTGPGAPGPAAGLFAATRARLPVTPPPDWALSTSTSPTAITLAVRGHGIPADVAPRFFPFGREVVEHAAPQTVQREADGFRLVLAPWSGATAAPDALAGLLTVGEHAYTIVVPTRAPVALQPLLLAFAGGLLLNLMPCVFPVLALKALALVGLAREGRRRMRLHGLAYGIGVLVSFWLLAGALLAVRAGGAQLGWGFQLQSPVVVALLASLFFWMALTLLGVSSIGGAIMGVGNRLTAGGGYQASFFTGVLATVVATPCTAPFMGTALGYALVQPPAVALGVFTSLGLGLAVPYVAITFVPRLGAFLPRPGAWMETLEQVLAFPLLATVVWLVWVVSLQAGPEAVLAVLTALLLLGFAAWIARRAAGRWGRVVAAAVVATALAIEVRIAPRAEMPARASAGLAWEPYSAARLGELLRMGKPVFVDFTAAWCVTCQVNERLALATPAVTAKMRALGVVAVRADWTRPNADISRALQEFGRDGIPLYVLYSGREREPPRILPQILTSETVLTELTQLETRS